MHEDQVTVVDVEESNAEVMQVDEMPMVTVPVKVEGHVDVRALPPRGEAEFVAINLPAGGVAQRVLNRDPLRHRAYIIVLGTQDAYIGSTQAQCNQSTPATMPAGLLQVPIETRGEVWMRSASANTAANVTLITEREF